MALALWRISVSCLLWIGASASIETARHVGTMDHQFWDQTSNLAVFLFLFGTLMVTSSTSSAAARPK